MTANLSLGQGRDPAHRKVERDVNDANDPETHRKVLALVHEAEDDGKDDAAEVAAAARESGQDAVGKGVDVRHERKVGSVARLVEDRHEHDEADKGAHSAAVGLGRVHSADEDEQSAGQQTTNRDPSLLEPKVTSKLVVQDIGNYTTEGSVDKVEESKDGSVVARLGLVQVREVLLQVRAQHSIDGKLAAEGASVGSNVEEGLGRVENRERFLEAGLDHNLALRNLHGLVACDRMLVVTNLDVLFATSAVLLV